MSHSLVLCPGGATSQSGAAVKERYPSATIESCGKIPEVVDMLATNEGPFVIPIWNSHEGEVETARYFWDLIQSQAIKIEDAWAKSIQFWFVQKTDDPKESFGVVGSVAVAGTQCSGFLNENKFRLQKCALTTTALQDYTSGEQWDGVLVAPGQGQGPNFKVINKQTANPNNFTSFMRIVPSRKTFQKTEEDFNSLTGVRMKAFGATMGESEIDFFERLLQNVSEVSGIPKLIFVFNRDSKVGLLFEGAPLYSEDLLDAEQLEGDSVTIFEEVGKTSIQYSEELKNLFESTFTDLTGKDFIKHIGVKSCLFACPPLQIYTHGYEDLKVEPVIKFYINKLFELWDTGALSCTPEQDLFFKRNHEQWMEKGSDFVMFAKVEAT